jgi:Ca2+/Na+ antiporter
VLVVCCCVLLVLVVMWFMLLCYAGISWCRALIIVVCCVFVLVLSVRASQAKNNKLGSFGFKQKTRMPEERGRGKEVKGEEATTVAGRDSICNAPQLLGNTTPGPFHCSARFPYFPLPIAPGRASTPLLPPTL